MINKNELSKESLSSINLAIENPNACFLSDDDITRIYAIDIGLNVIGTTRIIADATVEGEIKSIQEMLDTLNELKSKSNNLINDEMITDIVKVVENKIKIRDEENEKEKEADLINDVKKAFEIIESSDTPKHPFELFGIEHYFGWYGLTLPIIEEIRKYNVKHPKNEIKINQIKEKFGGLRFYVSSAPDYIHNMILKAEHESKHICEKCGARGSTENINGWIWTLCDEHKKAKKEANRDQELEERLYKNMLNIENYGWTSCNSNKEEEKEYRIIAAFSGVGKSALAKQYPDKVIDFGCMKYKYEIDDEEELTESDKANHDYELIFGWEDNYVEAIKQNMSDDKILVIPSDYKVLKLLEDEGIPYILCYPQREAKDIYHKRYIERGNSEEFIDIFIGRWDRFMNTLEEDQYGKHIILEPNQFLSDVIDVDALLSNKIPFEVEKLIPIGQLELTKKNLPAFQDCLKNLELKLRKCPKLHETDGMEEHPAIFHYFYDSSDIFICEYDRDDQMFGYSVLNGDIENFEWGYFNLSLLKNISNINIDYHFEEQSVEAILYKAYPKFFKKPKSVGERYDLSELE